MSKATRALSGASQRKYFRDLFAAGVGFSDEAAGKLLDVCTTEISQVRVRLPLPERGGKRKGLNGSAEIAKPGSVPPQADGAEFDPFAFSLVVVMTKGGTVALAEKLASIEGADHLRAIAKAQHIGVPAHLTDAAALRAALVEGTERRIADRKAAAS